MKKEAKQGQSRRETRRGKKRSVMGYRFPRTSSLLHFNFSPFAKSFQRSATTATRWHPFNIIILLVSLPHAIYHNSRFRFFFFFLIRSILPFGLRNVTYRFIGGDEFLRKCYPVTWNQCKTVERNRSSARKFHIVHWYAHKVYIPDGRLCPGGLSISSSRKKLFLSMHRLHR